MHSLWSQEVRVDSSCVGPKAWYLQMFYLISGLKLWQFAVLLNVAHFLSFFFEVLLFSAVFKASLIHKSQSLKINYSLINKEMYNILNIKQIYIN